MPGIQKKFSKGQVIISEGTEGKTVFLIRSGKVEVSKQTKEGPIRLAALGANEVFGEMSLIDDRFSKRTATVRAIEDTEVMILDRKGFDKYLENVPPGVYKLIKRLSNRLRETNDLISKVGSDAKNLPKALKTDDKSKQEGKLTYDQMTESIEAAVDLNLMPKKFKKGQVLVREDAEAMSVFMLKSGSVIVSKKLAGKEVEIDRLCINEAFGETSMFDDSGRRFTTVTALDDGEVVVFSKKDMDEMLRKAPLELILIMECLSQKLKRSILRNLELIEENQELKQRLDRLQSSLAETSGGMVDKTVEDDLDSLPAYPAESTDPDDPEEDPEELS
ncbi:MAG: cyclic nucleotide-binding domain-containing protein [Candidatus Glassbacteria bacterium]|nr:cyclic nucleotide-binding domain-containing protein [Candidatus Glassbacteria bacterium]